MTTTRKTKPTSNRGGRIPPPVRGQSLWDADAAILLSITNNDVAKATAKDPTNCAAARAIRRQLGVKQAVVMRSTTYINYGTVKAPSWARYKTGMLLAREITAIDRGGSFEPGDYNISPQPPSNALGRKPYVQPTKPTGKKKPRAYHVTANIREV